MKTVVLLNRSPLLLTLCVYLCQVTAVTEDMLEVKSVSGSDLVLTCTATEKPGVPYMAVRWYKVSQPPAPRLRGLLTKDLPDGSTQWYLGVGQEVELLQDSLNVLLRNVSCEDKGVYMCHLAAPVGEQNREGLVLLTLTDCQEAETLISDSYMVVLAAAVLITALIIFLISYKCLNNIIRDRSKTSKKEILLDKPLKPLQKKDLMLIYTLGPKMSKTPTMKHICV
ncbi:CD83 antigen [Sphaeramia orbicularis]|uniref:Uncharacterized LOC115435210 n=1 Tax=Sphaeramia orbicularis TaxID=375764 RepID=A0A673A1Q8_9TELE|nr:uncharacterized protein LOC115435210 [Sphaeramia orbicularis]